jgi:hypothetical protein
MVCRANINPRRTRLVRYIITRLPASARPNPAGSFQRSLWFSVDAGRKLEGSLASRCV